MRITLPAAHFIKLVKEKKRRSRLLLVGPAVLVLNEYGEKDDLVKDYCGIYLYYMLVILYIL